MRTTPGCQLVLCCGPGHVIPASRTMTTRFTYALPATAAAFLVAGCLGDGAQYPSLAMRDVERADGVAMPASAPPPVPAIVSVAELDAIVARARDYDRGFAAARPQASRLAQRAAGASRNSDLRSQALVALARLTTLHGQTTIALGELDRLEAQAAGSLAPITAIREAQTEVARIAAGQDAAIDSIGGTLGPG